MGVCTGKTTLTSSPRRGRREGAERREGVKGGGRKRRDEREGGREKEREWERGKVWVPVPV